MERKPTSMHSINEIVILIDEEKTQENERCIYVSMSGFSNIDDVHGDKWVAQREEVHRLCPGVVLPPVDIVSWLELFRPWMNTWENRAEEESKSK